MTQQIDDNKSQITSLIHQVGTRCVENHLNETGTEFEDLFSAIREKNRQNVELTAEIERLKAQQAAEEAARQQALALKEEADRVAREQAREARAAQKAAQQGYGQQPVASTIPSVMPSGAVKYCTNCGKPYEEDSDFCVYCGHPFENPAADTGFAQTLGDTALQAPPAEPNPGQ